MKYMLLKFLKAVIFLVLRIKKKYKLKEYFYKTSANFLINFQKIKIFNV